MSAERTEFICCSGAIASVAIEFARVLRCSVRARFAQSGFYARSRWSSLINGNDACASF